MTERDTRSPAEIARQANAEREQRQEREARERQEQREAGDKAAALRSWKAAGGDEASFENNWPKIRDEMRAERIKRRATAERAQHGRAIRRFF